MSNNSGFFQNGQPAGYGQRQNEMRNMPSAPVSSPSNTPFLPNGQNGQSPDATVRLDGRGVPPQYAQGQQRPNNMGPGQNVPATPPPSQPLPPRRPEETKSGLFKNKRLAVVGAIASGLLIVALVVLAVKGLSGGQADVTLYQTNSKNVNQSIGGGGITFPLQQINISYPVSEQVLKVPVKAGDQVTVGQALLQLDPTALNIQVQQAANNKAAAQAYLNSVSAAGNAVAIADAQKQYDQSTNTYNALVAQSSSPMLHNGNIIAPMAGVITALNINAGETFAANTPLITIMDQSSVIVHVKIPLTNLQQVHLGQTATVTPSAIPNLDLTGTVVSIVPVADPQTDTFEAWVQVKNSEQKLLPGMSAFVRIQTSGSTSMVVPRLAVINPSLDSMVFVVSNHVAHLQHVHISGRSADMVYIDSGLSNGETVVLTGIHQLKDGQAVRVTKIEHA